MSDKYMKNLTFANIAKACEGRYIGDETLLDTTITGAVIDSRHETVMVFDFSLSPAVTRAHSLLSLVNGLISSMSIGYG